MCVFFFFQDSVLPIKQADDPEQDKHSVATTEFDASSAVTGTCT